MAEITRRRTGEFLRKLFEILMAHPDGMQAKDTLVALAEVVAPTQYERATYPSGFTKDAETFARHREQRQITLVDLERLVELWTENYGKLDEAARRLLPLRPIYHLAPIDE
ncbi:MAG: hypothetical protein AABZ30_06335 [Myxococcota bacterium]